MRRALWIACFTAVLGLTGCIADTPVPATPDQAPQQERAAVAPAGRAPADAAPQRARARRPRIPKRVGTLAGALRRARIAGRLSERDYRTARRVDARARAAVGRLHGARRAELAAVLRNLDGLAAQGVLSSSRLALAVLTVRRNLEVFTRRALPRPGQRLTFGKDPTVFQHWSGHGVQFHPLATAGKANALANPCLAERRARERARVRRARGRGQARRTGLAVIARARPGGRRCRPRALRRVLGRLQALASDRGGYTAWEYLFPYGAGRPPWVSAMAQATAAQALARGGEALGAPRLSRVAVQALGAFDRPPPAGVSVPSAGGRHYVMYSFAPDLRILNGFLQSVIGLHDVAALTGSKRALRLYRDGERAARAAVSVYDTGAWSLYADGGRESTLGYHQLVRSFLGGLCDRARRRVYCGAEQRFTRYTHEPPRVRLARLRGVKAGRPSTLAFTLSKVSRVRVRVASRRGPALDRRLTLARGRHVLPWRPARRGRYRVRIDAVGPEGRRSVRTQSVRVRPVRRPKPEKIRRENPGTDPFLAGQGGRAAGGAAAWVRGALGGTNGGIDGKSGSPVVGAFPLVELVSVIYRPK